MDKVEIVKAKNGWLVFIGDHHPSVKNDPVVFTDWGSLSRYLRRQLAPEMLDIE